MPTPDETARILQVVLGGMNPQQQAADQQYQAQSREAQGVAAMGRLQEGQQAQTARDEGRWINPQPNVLLQGHLAANPLLAQSQIRPDYPELPQELQDYRAGALMRMGVPTAAAAMTGGASLPVSAGVTALAAILGSLMSEKADPSASWGDTAMRAGGNAAMFAGPEAALGVGMAGKKWLQGLGMIGPEAKTVAGEAGAGLRMAEEAAPQPSVPARNVREEAIARLNSEDAAWRRARDVRGELARPPEVPVTPVDPSTRAPARRAAELLPLDAPTTIAIEQEINAALNRGASRAEIRALEELWEHARDLRFPMNTEQEARLAAADAVFDEQQELRRLGSRGPRAAGPLEELDTLDPHLYEGEMGMVDPTRDLGN